MILALDVGNSQIFGGVFKDEKIVLRFRMTSRQGNTSDEIGMFLKNAIRESGLDPQAVTQIALCSVVPDLVHSIKGACMKYFGISPFVLQAGVKTGLKIKYRNPLEVGADRIANSVGAVHAWPDRDLIIVDYGTATTFCVVTAQKEYLGGLILPGFRISMEALESKTAKLPAVEILKPEELVGRSTVESIQSGLYFGNLCALTGITEEIKRRYFDGRNAFVVGTGGFSRLFENEKVFDVLAPDLVLQGLHLVLRMNT